MRAIASSYFDATSMAFARHRCKHEADRPHRDCRFRISTIEQIVFLFGKFGDAVNRYRPAVLLVPYSPRIAERELLARYLQQFINALPDGGLDLLFPVHKRLTLPVVDIGKWFDHLAHSSVCGEDRRFSPIAMVFDLAPMQ